MSDDQPTPEDLRSWRAAAIDGDADAMCNLGILRRVQDRLRGDDSAEHWWARAAQAGHDDATYNLEVLRDELGDDW